jgi:hypothetical protein
MRRDEEEKHVVDVSATLAGNIFWLFICLIAIVFFIIGFNQVSQFENEMNHLLGIIIISMATVRIFTWNGSPRIYLKERTIGEINFKKRDKNANE